MNSDACLRPPFLGRLAGLIQGIVPDQVQPAIWRPSLVVGSWRQSENTTATACSTGGPVRLGQQFPRHKPHHQRRTGVPRRRRTGGLPSHRSQRPPVLGLAPDHPGGTHPHPAPPFRRAAAGHPRSPADADRHRRRARPPHLRPPRRTPRHRLAPEARHQAPPRPHPPELGTRPPCRLDRPRPPGPCHRRGAARPLARCPRPRATWSVPPSTRSLACATPSLTPPPPSTCPTASPGTDPLPRTTTAEGRPAPTGRGGHAAQCE